MGACTSAVNKIRLQGRMDAALLAYSNIAKDLKERISERKENITKRTDVFVEEIRKREEEDKKSKNGDSRVNAIMQANRVLDIQRIARLAINIKDIQEEISQLNMRLLANERKRREFIRLSNDLKTDGLIKQADDGLKALGHSDLLTETKQIQRESLYETITDKLEEYEAHTTEITVTTGAKAALEATTAELMMEITGERKGLGVSDNRMIPADDSEAALVEAVSSAALTVPTATTKKAAKKASYA